ncbi:uncharacterized protein LOC144446918 [Glandiceps talaboti]
MNDTNKKDVAPFGSRVLSERQTDDMDINRNNLKTAISDKIIKEIIPDSKGKHNDEKCLLSHIEGSTMSNGQVTKSTEVEFQSTDTEKNLSTKVTNKSHLKEKLVFVTSVMCLITNAYGLFVIPWFLPYFFTVTAPILLGVRIWSYIGDDVKWHLFLLDFCYLANVICMVYIWGFPGNPYLFCITFGMANGPLLWAVALYRNSLVFHSLDRMTSLFIHLLPSFVTFAIRWHPDPTSQYWYTPFVTEHIQPSFIWLVAAPLGVFMAHGLLYSFTIYVVIRPSDEYMDSFRYFVSDEESFNYKLANMLGKRFQVVVYYLCCWVLCFGMILFCRLWYEFFIGHALFVLLVRS